MPKRNNPQGELFETRDAWHQRQRKRKSATKRIPNAAPIFDVFLSEMGMPLEKLTEDMRGEINAAIKGIFPNAATMLPPAIRDAAADVRGRSERYKRKWGAARYSAKAMAKHWPEFELIRRQEDVLRDFVDEWYVANAGVFAGHTWTTLEVTRLFLHVRMKHLVAGAFRLSPKLVAYARRLYGDLQYSCELHPDLIAPHVKVALEKLEKPRKENANE